MADYRQDWELEVDRIFLSSDLEEIVNGTRLFFQEINQETDQEQGKIWYWLSCAYRHREVSRTPFFPILFLYAVCENEPFPEETTTRYIGYAVRYIYRENEELQSKERQLRDGWLKRHMNQLPREHQKVARIYLEIVDCLFPEEERGGSDYGIGTGRNNTSGAGYWKHDVDSGSYIKTEDNRKKQKDWNGYDEEDAGGGSQDSSLRLDEDEKKDEKDEKEESGEPEGKRKRASSRKNLVIGLVIGLLIGTTLGCTGTALLLNGNLWKDRQQNVLQTDSLQPQSSRPESVSSDSESEPSAEKSESSSESSIEELQNESKNPT